MNAMTNRMVREAHDAIVATAAADPTIRVLLLTGDRAEPSAPEPTSHHFTSGDARRAVLTAREFEVTTLLHEMPAVTVAAVNGACAGAGMGWALACDLRVMAASAKMNTAFLDVAVAGDMAIPWSLPRIKSAQPGPATSRSSHWRIDADEARAAGSGSSPASFRDDTLPRRD